MAAKKYYVVWHGVEPGIYDTWSACQEQIKGFPNAKYKSFKSLSAAREAYESGMPKSAAKVPKKKVTPDLSQVKLQSWSVDAACSGNPGAMEYQGVHTADGTQIFYMKFPLGTNNVGEFLAIVHALALLKKAGNESMPIYTDSRNALLWVQKKKAKTTLVKNSRTKKLYETIHRAEEWLKNNDYKTPLLKWDTKKWGEIPADFGRK